MVIIDNKSYKENNSVQILLIFSVLFKYFST